MRTGRYMERPVFDLTVGSGFHAHGFAPGRALWLGGLVFEGEGLIGHSDGDVVCHAIADALLGAVALGDVGEHFPDTEPENAQASPGAELLGRALRLLVEFGTRRPCRSTSTVVCERPAIAPRRLEMRDRLASISGLPIDPVSVKATRPEGLGLTGEGIGCLALAVVG